jgi:hypothetical protein
LVDFITVLLKNTLPSDLEGNALLEFSMWRNLTEDSAYIPIRNGEGNILSDKNGDILYKTPYKSATYKNLCFTIYQTGTIILSGSLHKYFNNGQHNYNDFSYKSFLAVLKDLKDKFGITPKYCILRCLEIGVNINPPVPSNDILNHCFLHKRTVFLDKHNSSEGRYKQAEHSQYLIKIYNKALQYSAKGFDIPEQILRFEIKFTKMEKVNRLGISTLGDLERIGFQVFEEDLVKECNNILLYDPTIRSRSRILTKYSNPLYWTMIIKVRNRQTFYRQKSLLNKIIAESSDKVQQNVAALIHRKASELSEKSIQIDH